MSPENFSYSQALEELRAIHARLSATDVDVDRLLEDVQRASELLDFCHKRITAVGEQLEEVLQDFDQPAGRAGRSAAQGDEAPETPPAPS